MIKYYVNKQVFSMMKSGTKQERYIASLSHSSLLTTQRICELVSHACTLSPHEVELAIREIEDVIFGAIQNGTEIQLGELGYLVPIIKATSCETEEEVDFKTIKEVKYYLRPSKKLKAALNNLTFKKIKRKVGLK